MSFNNRNYQTIKIFNVEIIENKNFIVIEKKSYKDFKRTSANNSCFKAVPASSLGLTHPRRTKLQHGTFLHFGHLRMKSQ